MIKVYLPAHRGAARNACVKGPATSRLIDVYGICTDNWLSTEKGFYP